MDLLDSLQDAQAVVLGIGSEFAADIKNVISENDTYKRLNLNDVIEGDGLLYEYIKNSIFYHEIKKGTNSYIKTIKETYTKLAEMIEGKNYFIVTTCTDDLIFGCGFDEEKIVAPCGSVFRLQGEDIIPADEYLEKIYSELEKMDKEPDLKAIESMIPKTDSQMYTFNVQGRKDVKYNEQGYIPQWGKYTMWLQRTLNRQLVLLELGVDFSVPTVIRWPFEKIAMLNNKALLYRINGKLPQLPEDINKKGISVNQNSLEYIKNII